MSNNVAQFVSIPPLFTSSVQKEFSKYTPIILLDGNSNNELGINVGKSVSLASLPNKDDALEAARKAFLSTTGAIGYAVRGVHHD